LALFRHILCLQTICRDETENQKTYNLCKFHRELDLVVLAIIVVLITSIQDVFHPVFVFQIPVNCFADALFKLKRWLPSQLPFDFGGINGIPEIMTRTVLYKSNQISGSSFGASRLLIHLVTDYVDQVEIGPFIVAAYIIGLSGFSV